jgi:hypothetical protein
LEDALATAKPDDRRTIADATEDTPQAGDEFDSDDD